MSAYEKFAQVYDLFMDNIDYEGWAEYVTDRLREYEITDGLVLELGCGTGTMTGLLAGKGYDMIGVDEEEGLNYYELAVFLPREDGLYEKSEEVHCQKAYPQEEIETLIKEAGMELLAVYDAYTLNPATEDSERLFFVAREKGKKKQ